MSDMKIAFVGDVHGRVQHDRYLLFKKILVDYEIDFFSIKNKRHIKKLRDIILYIWLLLLIIES